MDADVQCKLQGFFNSYKQLTYKPGEIIIRADEEVPSFAYVLRTGFVKQYAISGKGDEIILNIFKPCCVLPLVSLLNDIPNHYYFETITESELIRIPKTDALHFLRNNTDVLYDTLQRMSRGLNSLLTNLEHLLSGHAHNKILMALLVFSRRFGENVNGYRVIKFKLTHKHIASFVGLSRETVSREMERLQKDHVIEKKDGLISIHNMKLLMDELLLEE